MLKNIDRVAPEQVQEIVRILVAARHARDLSQAELASQMGQAQGYLSRVEAGKVDFRTSNLVELARLLDLEVMLVPRQLVPVVRKITQGGEGESAFLYRLENGDSRDEHEDS